ncbi:unnamed protein product [Penicillium manginii]
MNVVGNSRQTSTTETGESGHRRRRIRPSRARGLRTRTGCLTCRERRVKCDDGKPTCLRCSKSDRICRYAQNITQDVDQRHAARAENEGEPARTHPDSRENTRSEDIASIGDGRANNIHAPQAEFPSPSPQQGIIGIAPHPQATCPTPAETVAPLHRGDLIGPTRHNHLNEHHGQRLPSFDSTFPESPLSPSQVSLLNTSAFEWYDLLARDAISDIQRQNADTSNGDPSWKSFEIALSRKQSVAPEDVDSRPEQARNHYEEQQQQTLLHSCDDRTGESAPGHHPLSTIWNTATAIELSEIDLSFFRYYIQVVGPILDLFDPGRHLTNVVPHVALRNKGLLKSILAVGAKHMSLSSSNVQDGGSSGNQYQPNENAPTLQTATGLSLDSETTTSHMATQYYYETLHYLSQTLLYPAYADSHEILATATMISTYEMFDCDSVPNSGVWEQHLRGSFWIQRSQDNDGESVDGLRRAVWWAWLRQDIWAAFQAGRPTITFWRARKPLETLNSDELATRIVYLCGKCVKYAASDKILPNQDPRDRIDQGDRLLSALADWYRILPISYQPVTVATSPTSNTLFPPIWIHPTNHAGAMQMYHLARTAVLLNQPTMGGLSTYMQREKQLTESVKIVCGIANSCQENEPAMAFVNVQALFAVGQFVRLPEMREELLNVLDHMLRISGFPSKGLLVARLKKCWEE